MKLVAITGSIGCGKTTIANILRKQGFFVFDIDKWVKYIYYKKDFLNIIKSEFPESFENNIFNKRILRNIVFNDNKSLKKLENLIHPYLENKLKKIIRKNVKNDYLAFVDVALLYEMGWDKYFDIIILADVDKITQMNRVMSRDKISADDFYKIDNIQISQDEKRKKVDFVINTGINENKLKTRVLRVVEDILLYV